MKIIEINKFGIAGIYTLGFLEFLFPEYSIFKLFRFFLWIVIGVFLFYHFFLKCGKSRKVLDSISFYNYIKLLLHISAIIVGIFSLLIEIYTDKWILLFFDYQFLVLSYIFCVMCL